MQALYNIYYAGEVLEGEDPAAVRASLAALFKADAATLDKLFSGSPQLVKRGCDRPTALKYKQAMEKAGARPLIRAAETAAGASPEKPRPMSAAERIAALAAAPDVGYTAGKPEPATETSPDTAPESSSGIGLTPAGTEVLTAAERSQPVEREIDTSELAAEGGYGRLAAAAPPPPPAPDTGQLSLGEAGEPIPNLSLELELESPDTTNLELAPEGTDFSDCAAPAAAAPDLDLSAIDLAPQGSDVLPEQFRRKPAPDAAPDTDHITLED